MASSLALRSFRCNVYNHGVPSGRKLTSYPMRRNVKLTSRAKTSDAIAAIKSDDAIAQSLLEKNNCVNGTIFPNELEALMLEICDETEVAELKLKVGAFEMHLKRHVGVINVPLSNISPTAPPPVPTKPMEVSATTTPTPTLSNPPPKPSAVKSSPFTNVSFGNSDKLTALEASGASGYSLVASPTVGTFRRSRTVKGKKLPPTFKEGDMIKEGQVIGYLDQFGTELPVKSDVAGEVLKLLINDGDAVGYGDPLVAVLPSFHGINN